MKENKVNYGIHIAPQIGFDYQTVEKLILSAEQNNMNFASFGDHLFLNAENAAERNCMETWTLLSAIAAKTSKIKVGTLVSCNLFRNPAILAKIAATIDLISNGRLIFGIGAGWNQIECDAYGINFLSAGDRMDQLEEAIQIIRRLWTEPKASFEGKHYQIKNAFCAPKPVQKPHPPLLIGGAGEKRTLKIVAKYADMCNFTFIEGKKIERLLTVLKMHCENVGRDYTTIEKTFLAICFISDDTDLLQDHVKRVAKARKKTFEEQVQEIKSEPGICIGTPEEVREKCNFLINNGFSQIQMRFEQNEPEMIELFNNSVIKGTI